MKEVYELMKKTLSRFLCALLVVAMVCAMAPAALAGCFCNRGRYCYDYSNLQVWFNCDNSSNSK
jgi:hypothetical protein